MKLSKTILTTMLSMLFTTVVAADDHGNSTSNATAIGNNSSTNGYISRFGDKDYFKVTLNNSGKLIVDTTGSLDTYGYLYSADGTELASNDDAGAGNNFSISYDVQAGTYYIKAKAYSFWSAGDYVLNAEYIPTVLPKQKVVLLMHGLNSSPDTWNKFITNEFPNGCNVIDIADRYNHYAPNSKTVNNEVVCYNLAFGEYDVSNGAKGLTNEACSGSCSGDYETFEELSEEVHGVVNKITDVYSGNAEFVFIAHSRGGLAARTYLQNSANVNSDKVKGLITTGTPHKGSPLGRSYQYMADNCIDSNAQRVLSGSCTNDWLLFDQLKSNSTLHLDLAVPSIKYLAPEHSEVISLEQNIQNLPLSAEYTQMVYTGRDLGVLAQVPGFDPAASIWEVNTLVFNLAKASDSLKMYMLNGQTRASYSGDGIVSTQSQQFGQHEFTDEGLHGFETEKSSDLSSQLNGIKQTIQW